MKVDSFKRSSKIKSYLLFEVDFLLFYAHNKRNLSEFDLSKMVRGVRFILSFKTVKRHFNRLNRSSIDWRPSFLNLLGLIFVGE